MLLLLTGLSLAQGFECLGGLPPTLIVDTVAVTQLPELAITVEKIQMAADGKSAQATLKDNKSGNPVVIFINDDETLDKFKDKRIGVGDEIRTRFDDAGGKNQSKSFKKTAGC